MSPTMQDAQMLRISSDPMYLLLREGRIQEFNQKKSAGAAAVLTGCDFRNVDLRGMDAAGLDFSHSYFRQADLHGDGQIVRFTDGLRNPVRRELGPYQYLAIL